MVVPWEMEIETVPEVNFCLTLVAASKSLGLNVTVVCATADAQSARAAVRKLSKSFFMVLLFLIHHRKSNKFDICVSFLYDKEVLQLCFKHKCLTYIGRISPFLLNL